MFIQFTDCFFYVIFFFKKCVIIWNLFEDYFGKKNVYTFIWFKIIAQWRAVFIDYMKS